MSFHPNQTEHDDFDSSEAEVYLYIKHSLSYKDIKTTIIHSGEKLSRKWGKGSEWLPAPKLKHENNAGIVLTGSQRSDIVDMVDVTGAWKGEHNKEREEKEMEKLVERGQKEKHPVGGKHLQL